MARKEVVVEDAVRLMRNPKNIRNMGIVAHVDHGKCISGKTRLVLTNGHTMDAKALYESIQTNGIRVQKTDSETVYAPQTPAHVFSLNKTTGRIEEKPLTLAWKLNGGPVKTLTLRNGLQVTTTPEHKFIVLSNLSFAEKQAGELRIGAWVVCPKKLEVQSSMDLRSEIFEQLSHRNDVYFILKPEFAKWLHETNELQPLMADAQTKLAKAGFKGCLKRGRFKASDLANICKAKGIPFSLAYERISGVFYRAGGKKGKNGKIMKLPSKFEDFFYLAGLLFGDGSRDKLVVGKPELEVEFVRILNDLGITPVCREYSGKTKEISAGSKTLLAFLELFFDYPQKKKSHNIRCSDFLVRAPASCVAAFLRGHFDCDGTVEKSRGAVSITCVSPAMLSGIQLLLLRFNVASNRQGDTLYISGNSISRFNEHIGFLVSEKKAKAAKLESRAVGSYALDVIPLSANALKSAKGVRSMTSVANNFYEYANQKTRPTIGSMMKISQKLSHEFLAQLCSEELMFVQVKNIQDDVEPEVYDFTVEDNHNFVAEGMFIHNTTLSDSLVARAGLISKELAGEQRVLDFDEQEQARGITIKAANITLGFSLDGKEYLINLIDTPGHVDFGGHVTRAMRAVDGAIIVVDSVEGIMPQTETVLRQALKEKVRPVLFINKIDRLMNELKLDSKGMQDRFLKVITGVNKLIDQYGPEEFKNDWKIEVAKGNVAFGSGFYKWAVSAKTMKKFNITFKDMYDMCVAGDHKKLQQKAPLDDVILSMVIEHLPSPVDAQKYRIPVIWHGDKESRYGKAMISCDPKGPVTFMITAIQVDPHAGDVAVGRIYSGTLKKGVDLYLATQYKTEKLQGVAVYMGPDRVLVEEAPAGNIVALVGLKEMYAGETVSEGKMESFEKIKHHSEPVVTKSIEAKNPRDLVKLIEVLRKIGKEDPTLKVVINQETGEQLISGMGELHLEIIEYKIRNERGVEIETSPPIVVYEETIQKKGPELEGKSPNKHNKFKLYAEPLEESVLKAMRDGTVDPSKKGKELTEKLIEAGLPRDEAKSVMRICEENIFIDYTKGVQYLQDIKELLLDAFDQAMSQGPLAKEKCVGVKVKLTDASIHVDPAHRGPAQIIPAVRRPIYASMLQADCVLLEPKQKLFVNVPSEYMSSVINLVQGRRGQIADIQQEGESVNINSKVPVSQMFGFATDVRGASQGRAVWYYEYAGYEKLPTNLQAPTITSIRKRKGEPETPPTAKDFMD